MSKLLCFRDRVVHLSEMDTIVVGRASTKGKQEAKNDNMYFDCPVLSRRHATFYLFDGDLYLRDEDSTHGTHYSTESSASRDTFEKGTAKIIRDKTWLMFGQDVYKDGDTFEALFGTLRIQDVPATPPLEKTDSVSSDDEYDEGVDESDVLYQEDDLVSTITEDNRVTTDRIHSRESPIDSIMNKDNLVTADEADSVNGLEVFESIKVQQEQEDSDIGPVDMETGRFRHLSMTQKKSAIKKLMKARTLTSQCLKDMDFGISSELDCNLVDTLENAVEHADASTGAVDESVENACSHAFYLHRPEQEMHFTGNQDLLIDLDAGTTTMNPRIQLLQTESTDGTGVVASVVLSSDPLEQVDSDDESPSEYSISRHEYEGEGDESVQDYGVLSTDTMYLVRNGSERSTSAPGYELDDCHSSSASEMAASWDSDASGPSGKIDSLTSPPKLANSARPDTSSIIEHVSDGFKGMKPAESLSGRVTPSPEEDSSSHCSRNHSQSRQSAEAEPRRDVESAQTLESGKVLPSDLKQSGLWSMERSITASDAVMSSSLEDMRETTLSNIDEETSVSSLRMQALAAQIRVGERELDKQIWLRARHAKQNETKVELAQARLELLRNDFAAQSGARVRALTTSEDMPTTVVTEESNSVDAMMADIRSQVSGKRRFSVDETSSGDEDLPPKRVKLTEQTRTGWSIKSTVMGFVLGVGFTCAGLVALGA